MTSTAEDRLKKRFNALPILGIVQGMMAFGALVFALVALIEMPLGLWSAVITCVFAMLPPVEDFMLHGKVSTFIKTGETKAPISTTETWTEIHPVSGREIQISETKTKLATVPTGYTEWHFERLQPQTLAKYTSLMWLSFIVCLAGGVTLLASLALAGSPYSDSIGVVAGVLIVAYTLMISRIALLQSARGILSSGVKAQT